MGETIELYRCTECGKLSVSLGWLHGHIQAKHTGFGPFNIIPNPLAMGNGKKLMEMTEVLQVTGVVSVEKPEMVEQ